jgi:hypothetical protein
MNRSQLILLAPWAGCLLGLPCLSVALRAARRGRLIEDLPVSKTTGVFIGLVDLQGTAESEEPLTSYLAGQTCVYYDWRVEEHWSRTVVESYTDNQGRTQTRTRQESGWTTVAQGSQTQAFYLQDDCGVIRVLPQGAQFQARKLFDQVCGRGDALYYSKGPALAIADSDHRRRFVESAIPLHAPLYVMGQARERQDVVAPEIAADDSAPVFLISTRTREQIRAGFGWAEWGWGLAGLCLFVAGLAVRDIAAGRAANPLHYLVLAAVYLCAAAAGWVWMAFNSLVDLRQRVRQGWSQVDVQLKRRHDLIPNLVQTIQGFRDYERTLQAELAQLRAQLTATAPGEPGPDFHACGKILIAVAERYPELKAQSSFLNLQKALAGTEQRIALARGYFNDIATFYNTRLQIIPDRFVGAVGAMKPQPLMAANEFERAPVEVSLATGGDDEGRGETSKSNVQTFDA